MVGQIHSIESMGLVDGPGIRTVVFMQGCDLRCCFCHNPDTWSRGQAKEMTPEDLLRKIIRFKSYFQKSGGGVTFSGGEPLLQPEFLAETMSLCKENGIHTCLDTAGKGFSQTDYDKILQVTDLVLYDVKHYTEEGYQAITGCPMDETLKFVEAMKRNHTNIWIRHVIIPGVTDSKEHMAGLKQYINTIPNVQKVELLPYHLLGVNKYEVMGLPYPLDGVPSMDQEQVKKLMTEFFSE